jgi:hypothetical protein
MRVQRTGMTIAYSGVQPVRSPIASFGRYL